jgi:hypothetical protein
MHSLIIGTSLSGKTTLAKKLAVQYKNSGISIIVFCKFKDEWQGITPYIYTNRADFLRAIKVLKNCAFFTDESGQTIGRNDAELEATATDSRHKGHQGHYICHRPAQISPVMRYQCGQLYLFNSSLYDCKILYNEYPYEDILTAHQLKQGHYLKITKFKDIRKCRLW